MATTEKIDLFKLHKADYVAPKKPTLVDVAEARYLTIAGEGAPGGPESYSRSSFQSRCRSPASDSGCSMSKLL